MIFFLLIHFLGRATAVCSSASWPCLNFQHHNCIACWENCMPEFLTVFVPSPLFLSYLYLYLSTATPTFHGNFVLVVIFSCSPVGHDFLCTLSTTFHGNPRVTKSCGLFTIFIYRKSLETVKCFGRRWVNLKLLGVLLVKVSLFYQNLPDMEFWTLTSTGTVACFATLLQSLHITVWLPCLSPMYCCKFWTSLLVPW